MFQSLLQVVSEWVLGTQTPSDRVFGALGYLSIYPILSYPILSYPILSIYLSIYF